jgi:hypothetical protein
MSVIKFKLTEDHLKLVRQLQVDVERVDDELEGPQISGKRPFGNSDIFEDMFLILYGKPENEDLDVNPWDEQEDPWDIDQLENMKKLLGELPYALDIVLYTGKFETGEYKTKTYLRDWKKID